jgi:hypothetical protein
MDTAKYLQSSLKFGAQLEMFKFYHLRLFFNFPTSFVLKIQGQLDLFLNGRGGKFNIFDLFFVNSVM